MAQLNLSKEELHVLIILLVENTDEREYYFNPSSSKTLDQILGKCREEERKA